MSIVIHWNGKDIPQEFHELPAGRYVFEAVDEPPALSDEEDTGLRMALASLRQGKGVDVATARRRIEKALAR